MNSVNKVVSLGTSCLNTCFSLFKRIYNFSGSFFNPSSPVSKKEELEKSVNTMEEQEKKASEESVNTQEKPLKEESEKSVNTQEKPLKEESEKSVNTMEKQENPPIEKPLIEKNRETNLPNTYLPNEDEVNKCDAEVAQKKQNTPPRDQFFQEVFKKAKGLSEEDNYSVFVNYVFKKFIPSDVQEFKSDVQEFKLDEDTVGKQFTMTLSQKRTSNAFPMKWKGLGPNVTFSFPKKIQVSAAFEYKDGSPMYRIIFSGSPITAEGVGTGYTVSATLKEIVFDGEGVSLITGNEKCSGKNKFMTVPINLAIENAKENGIFIKPQVFEKYFEPLTWLK